jgi:hypothetical protein
MWLQFINHATLGLSMDESKIILTLGSSMDKFA